MSSFSQRRKRRAATAAARKEHGDAVRQLWVDSGSALPKFEAQRAGVARVPEALLVDRPAPEVLVEATPSQRAWIRQKRRDARAETRRKVNAQRRERRAIAAATPQPSRRDRILAARDES